MPILKSSSAAPVTRHAIVLDLGDLHQQAAEILASAERDAERIVIDAREEAQKIIDGAEEIGHEQGDTRGFTEGRERGIVEGREAAIAEYGERLEALHAAWSEELERWETDFDAILAGAREDVLRFAIVMGRKVILRAVELDPSVVQTQLAETLRLVCRPSAIEVEVHPDDRELVDAVLPALAQRLVDCRHVDVVESADVGRGGCRMRTAGGAVDATIERQVERIVQTLLPGPVER